MLIINSLIAGRPYLSPPVARYRRYLRAALETKLQRSVALMNALSVASAAAYGHSVVFTLAESMSTCDNSVYRLLKPLRSTEAAVINGVSSENCCVDKRKAFRPQRRHMRRLWQIITGQAISSPHGVSRHRHDERRNQGRLLTQRASGISLCVGWRLPISCLETGGR